MNDSRQLKIPDHVLHQNLQGETVLLDLESGTYFGLDEVGTRFWELVSAHGSFNSALESLLDEYEVDRARLETDLGSLVESLVDRGLLVVNDPGE